MTNRLFSVLRADLVRPRVRHYRGFPPEVTAGADERREEPPTAALLLEARDDGVFLERFAADGTEINDTWHVSVEDAKEQADFEFGYLLGDWREVPRHINDVASFLRNESKRQSD